MNPPPAVPLAWTNWFRLNIQVFHVDLFVFFTVILYLSSLDWTHAEFWGR